ncbi:MAG: DNA-binding domain-containing protein [Pseudomonadota bacterium]
MDFSAALLDPSAPIPDGLIAPDGRAAGKRFDVYRNNVTTSLIDAMRTGFPVVEKLIGAKNFGTLALMYVRAHPPTSPVLMFYGAAFPDFIAAFEPLQSVPYLPDVARLELARRDAYHAQDVDAMMPDDFAALGEAGMKALNVSRHPAVRIVASPHPIHDIWLRNSGAPDHPIAPSAQHVVVTRPGLDVQMAALSPVVAAFFETLSELGVGAAIEAALTQTPDFPLSEAFAILMQSGFAARTE